MQMIDFVRCDTCSLVSTKEEHRQGDKSKAARGPPRNVKLVPAGPGIEGKPDKGDLTLTNLWQVGLTTGRSGLQTVDHTTRGTRR